MRYILNKKFTFFLSGILFLFASIILVHSCLAQNGSESGLQLASLLENRGISFSLVAVAGLLDGLNPCAIGMLIMLLGYIIVFAHQSQRLVKNGMIYIITVFVTYFIVGAFLSQFMYEIMSWRYFQEASVIVKYFIVIMLFLTALLNIKDFFWYGRWFTLGVTDSQANFLQRFVRQIDWSATIILAVLVVIFELPCSLPLYLGSISLMSQAFTYTQTILYLLLYCFMFILPLIIVYAILVETKETYALKDKQEKYNRWLKLSMGLAQLVMAFILWRLL